MFSRVSLWRQSVFGFLVLIMPAICNASACHAGIMVAVENATIQAGSTGSVNVRLISGSVLDNLWGYGIELEIVSSNGRILEFAHTGGTPADTHLTSPDYVFSASGSAGITSGQTGFVGPNTTYVGLDASDSVLGIYGPFNSLLVTLDLKTLTSMAPVAGDTFSINVVTSNGNTFFVDPSFADIDPLFTTSHGVVTITGFAAVPEPGSAGIVLGFCLTTAFLRRRWKWKAKQPVVPVC
jgi:hypothetical protein